MPIVTLWDKEGNIEAQVLEAVGKIQDAIARLEKEIEHLGQARKRKKEEVRQLKKAVQMLNGKMGKAK